MALYRGRSYEQVECFLGRNPEPYTEPYAMEGPITRGETLTLLIMKMKLKLGNGRGEWI
jgi:hypothetical protein